MNTFDVLCGKYGDADTSYPFTYPLYGGVYANLIYQIVFLIIALALYEYGSADWFQPLFFWRRNRPTRLHHTVDNEGLTLTSFDSRRDIMLESPKHNIPLTTAAARNPILEVDRVTKYFGRSFAAQNVSLMISANETLALLGGNGAGKTTVINMIRGELKPNFGNVYVNGVSMLRQPGTARLHIGVCPQDDAVDNLTVRQTLEFYASVKGLKRVKDNVDQVMNALDISAYEKVKARALSGGTKRKLTVAIALLGTPFYLPSYFRLSLFCKSM
jgi:ABC-type glutathione transport system ATPase component